MSTQIFTMSKRPKLIKSRCFAKQKAKATGSGPTGKKSLGTLYKGFFSALYFDNAFEVYFPVNMVLYGGHSRPYGNLAADKGNRQCCPLPSFCPQ